MRRRLWSVPTCAVQIVLSGSIRFKVEVDEPLLRHYKRVEADCGMS